MTDREALSHINSEVMKLHSMARRHHIQFAAFVDSSESDEVFRAMVNAPPAFQADVIIALAQNDPHTIAMANETLSTMKPGDRKNKRIRNPNDDDDFTTNTMDA